METLAYLLVGIGVIAMLAGALIFTIAAFRVSLMWGLATIFIPFAALVFLIKYWHDAKTGFMIQIGGMLVFGLGWVVVAAVAAPSMMAELEDFDMSSEPMERTGIDPFEEQPLPATAADGSDSMLGLPTPTPMVADDPSLRPTPTEVVEGGAPPPLMRREVTDWKRPIATAAAADHIGEIIEIEMNSGKVMRVTLESVDQGTLFVKHKLGGGSMSYSIAIDNVRQIRVR